MDVAVIGLKAESKPIKDATKDLDRFTDASKRADNANDNRAASDRKVAAASTVSAAATDKNTTAIRAATQAQMALAKASNMAAFRQRQLAVQSLDVAQSLALGMPPMMVAVQQGGQIAGIYAGQGGVAAAFKEAAGMVGRFVAAHPALIAATAAIGLGFMGMANEISNATGETVTMGQVFSATVETIKQGIMGVLQPSIAAISPWFSYYYDRIISDTKTVGNFIIGAFVKMFETIKTLWDDFPNVIGDVIKIAAFRVTDGVAIMAQDTIRMLNTVINKASELSQSIGGPAITARLDPQMIQLPDMPELTSAGGAALLDRLDEINRTDYMGNFYEAIKGNVIKAMDEAKGSADGAGDAISKAANDNIKPWQDLAAAQQQSTDAIENARNIMQGFLSDIRNGIQQGKDFWDSMKNAALNALNSIADKLFEVATNQLIAAVLGGGSFGGPSPAMAFSGSAFSLFARGTNNAPGGMALVGERGPELVNIPRGARVKPANETANMLGKGAGDGGFSPTINIDARGAGPGVEQKIRSEVDSALANYASGEYDRFRANHERALKRDYRYRNG